MIALVVTDWAPQEDGWTEREASLHVELNRARGLLLDVWRDSYASRRPCHEKCQCLPARIERFLAEGAK